MKRQITWLAHESLSLFSWLPTSKSVGLRWRHAVVSFAFVAGVTLFDSFHKHATVSFSRLFKLSWQVYASDSIYHRAMRIIRSPCKTGTDVKTGYAYGTCTHFCMVMMMMLYASHLGYSNMLLLPCGQQSIKMQPIYHSCHPFTHIYVRS